MKTFIQIVLPLSKPGLATIGLFACIGYWNDWYMPMLFITKEHLVNLSYYIQRIMGSLQYLTANASKFSGLGEQVSRLPAEGARMAVVMITIGPIILVYPFFQRYFVKGLTIGAVKG
jgi:putative aldouronate transport system permease protein